jgi:hypothetical protein
VREGHGVQAQISFLGPSIPGPLTVHRVSPPWYQLQFSQTDEHWWGSWIAEGCGKPQCEAVCGLSEGLHCWGDLAVLGGGVRKGISTQG